MRYAYAIEYDCINPIQLDSSLEFKNIKGLFSAGQANGSSGYEEAAAQGIIAGINAAMKLKGEEPLILDRSDAYIGVLIDDLVTKETQEPYRMMTSRAEYRLLLRQDNADSRLTPLSHSIGLASDSRMRRVEEKEREVGRLSSFIEETPVLPSAANALLELKQTSVLQQKVKLLNLLLRPEITLEDLKSVDSELEKLIASVPDAIRGEVAEESEILLKYQRYIEKERDVASKILKFEDIALPSDFDYFSLQALSYESREKLTKMKPKTIGQASRISGVSPADVSVLIIYLTRQ